MVDGRKGDGGDGGGRMGKEYPRENKSDSDRDR